MHPLMAAGGPPMRPRITARIATLFGLTVIAAAALASDAGLTTRAGPSIEYQLERASADKSSLIERFTTNQRAVLEKLNRADASHLAGLNHLVVPTLWLDELEYTPFPWTYPPSAAHPKLLIVDLSAQAFVAYEHGALVQWGPVSSGGRASATPKGLFHLTWRSRGHHSSVNPQWFMEWYFNFDNVQGLALHSYALPGRPASHGCIRLLERDAQWLHAWGEGWTRHDNGAIARRGTPLLIVGEYAFDSPPPWRDLTYIARGIRLPETLPLSTEQPLRPVR